MRFKGTVFIPALLALAMMAALCGATARAGVIYETGGCPGTSDQWIVVVVYDDNSGRVLDVYGTDCNGRTWAGHCDIAGLQTPPEKLPHYVEALPHDAWIGFNVTAEGHPSDLIGRDASGSYWTAAQISIA